VFENIHQGEFASLLSNRVTAVVVFFIGWGAIHLLAAGLNAGSQSPFFYTTWLAVYGLLFVVSGGLLYSRHWVGVPAGFTTIGIALLSHIYEWATYPIPTDTIIMTIIIYSVLAYTLITIARDH
jgi:hypothetical protein